METETKPSVWNTKLRLLPAILIGLLLCAAYAIITDFVISGMLSDSSQKWMEGVKNETAKITPQSVQDQLQDDVRHIDRLEIEHELLQKQLDEKGLMIGLESAATLVTFIVAVIAIVLSEKTIRDIARAEAQEHAENSQTYLAGRFDLIVGSIFSKITWHNERDYVHRGFQDLSREAIESAEDAVEIFSKNPKGPYAKYKIPALNNLLFYYTLAAAHSPSAKSLYADSALETAESLRKDPTFKNNPPLVNTYVLSMIVFFDRLSLTNKTDKQKKVEELTEILDRLRNPSSETARVRRALKKKKDEVDALP